MLGRKSGRPIGFPLPKLFHRVKQKSINRRVKVLKRSKDAPFRTSSNNKKTTLPPTPYMRSTRNFGEWERLHRVAENYRRRGEDGNENQNINTLPPDRKSPVPFGLLLRSCVLWASEIENPISLPLHSRKSLSIEWHEMRHPHRARSRTISLPKQKNIKPAPRQRNENKGEQEKRVTTKTLTLQIETPNRDHVASSPTLGAVWDGLGIPHRTGRSHLCEQFAIETSQGRDEGQRNGSVEGPGWKQNAYNSWERAFRHAAWLDLSTKMPTKARPGRVCANLREKRNSCKLTASGVAFQTSAQVECNRTLGNGDPECVCVCVGEKYG